MYDFLVLSFKLDDASWFLLITMTVAALFVIHSLLDDTMVTALSLPAVVLFAAMSKAALLQIGFQLSSDRAINTSFGFGLGIFILSLIMAFMFWFKRTALNR